MLDLDGDPVSAGLCGFNGLLVGLAIATSAAMPWGYLVIPAVARIWRTEEKRNALFTSVHAQRLFVL